MSLFKVMSHVSVTVTDVAKAREFYTGILGFKEIARPNFDFPGIWYSLGGELQLHLILNDQLVRPAVEREKITARYPHFALWTEDCDETAQRLEKLGRIVSRSTAGRTSWSFRMMWSWSSPPRLYQMPGKSKFGRGISVNPRSPV